MDECPFCHRDPDRLFVATTVAAAFFDTFPVSEGHVLVVPRRHISSIFDLTSGEQSEVWDLVARVRTMLIERLGVTSFTIGVNDGLDAGQTVPHAHVHVIPRRAGDVPDPRGGIRWIIPAKADYWTSHERQLDSER